MYFSIVLQLISVNAEEESANEALIALKMISDVKENLSDFRNQKGTYSHHAKNMEYEINCTTGRDIQILIPKHCLDLSDHCQFIDILHYCTIWKIKVGY